MSKHIPKMCMIGGCKIEATRWVDTESINPMDLMQKECETFYLCTDHALELSPDDSMVRTLRVDTGEIIISELAVYSCSDDCEVCNA